LRVVDRRNAAYDARWFDRFLLEMPVPTLPSQAASLVLSLSLILGLTGAAAQAQTVVSPLYSATAGTLPTAQGWLPGVNSPPGATVQVSNHQLQISTLANNAIQFGYGRFSPLPLDTVQGFTLSFTLRVDGGVSNSPNRSGFSLLFVGSDPSQSLELTFRSNEVFMYDFVSSDPDRMVRGATHSFGAGSSNAYELRVLNNAFTLNVQGQDRFSAPLVNYSSEGFPYNTANLLFFGDNTTRASTNAFLGNLVLVSNVPEPAAAAMWLLGLAALGGWTRRRLRHRV